MHKLGEGRNVLRTFWSTAVGKHSYFIMCESQTVGPGFPYGSVVSETLRPVKQPENDNGFPDSVFPKSVRPSTCGIGETTVSVTDENSM